MHAQRLFSTKKLFPLVIATLAITVIGSLCFVLNGGLSIGSTSARNGLVYRGMVLGASNSACNDGYELLVVGLQKICTHGPDPSPNNVDVRQNRPPEGKTVKQESNGQVQAASVSCTGDGQSGDRVQLVYAYISGQPNRYNDYAASFQQWAQNMNRGVADSAAKTGGTSQIRFVHNANCVPVVEQLQLTSSGGSAFNNTIYEAYAAGYNRPDRKYLLWVDANVYCGISTLATDDRPTLDNASNTQTSWSRVDNGCWGQDNSVELHEMVHMLGGVQTSAPHSDTAGHCTDEFDRMCYASVPGVSMTYPCTTSQERLLDCNNDDYFSAGVPPAGSYLASHWNTANSSFLATVANLGGSSGGLRHPDGTLIKDPYSQAIYWIEDGTLHRVGDPAIFQSHNLRMSQVKVATSEDLSQPVSTDLWFREGTLIKGSGPQIYIVDQMGVGIYSKRHILSPSVLQVLGYRMQEVFTIPDGDLPHVDGESLGDNSSAHPDGALVKAGNSPDVYWIDNGQRRRVGDPAIFVSQNIDPAKVRPITSGDQSLLQAGDVYFREGTLLRASGQSQVYAVDYSGSTILKRYIPSPEVFQGLRYVSGDIFGVSNSTELPSADGANL